MGFMIQVLFEPNILGMDRLWCTACGRVHEPESIVWRTASNPSNNRAGDGSDIEESPHHPECPYCGEDRVIGEAVHDGFMLRMKGEPYLYPRRMKDDGITRKELKLRWRKVKPYRTKKGHMSEWKPDKAQTAADAAAYDLAQAKLAMVWEGDDLDGNLEEVRDLYEKVSVGVYNRSMANGLVIIRSRRHWAGPRKLGMKPQYEWLAPCELDADVKVRVTKPITVKNEKGEDEVIKVKAWVRTVKAKEGEEAIMRNGLVRTMRWVDLNAWSEMLDAEGLHMNRGTFITDNDVNSEDYLCSFWWEPREKRYVMVADAVDGWTVCGYDEAQGEDPDGEVLYDENEWLKNTVEEGIAAEPQPEEEEKPDDIPEEEEESSAA